VERGAERGVCGPAAIALLLDQRAPASPVPLNDEMLPDEAKIAASQAWLDGYVVSEPKEVAA